MVVQQVGPVISSYGLENHGLKNLETAHWNYTTAQLVEEAIRRREAHLAAEGPLVARTGHHTGRSPNDKFIVEDEVSRDTVNWGNVNRPISEERFDALHARLLNHLQERELYVQDCYAGADADFRLPVRVICENAWHNLFARNMFIQPPAAELKGFAPGFTVIQAPSFHADPEVDGTNSEVCILVSFKKKLVLIGGTSYAGEIKKSIFSVLNYMLPERGVFPMHCSANQGPDGDSAIFFGLSGTGKTTLSADASRTLIGDDEHGWGETGVFNFEGGCYAKVIKLSAEAEPEIHATTRRFGTILENVMMDMDDRSLDLDDGSLTENTRASYPLDFIPNASASGKGPHPTNIVMLTCDAFGVLPPVSRLTPEQAMYHFLSGYTARVAGTEKGVKEPQATFSTCFGAPFMPRHPTAYANLLRDMMNRHQATCWLVNTGWSGGPYGTGERMKIKHTRAMIHGILDGSLSRATFARDPIFGMDVPTTCPDVPDQVLMPRNTWPDAAAYDAKAKELAGMFAENFRQYWDAVDDGVRMIAIKP